MTNNEIIHKEAIDEDGKVLGRILRLEEHVEGLEKKFTVYAIIESVRFLQKNVHVPVTLERLIIIDESYVKFNITRKEFYKIRNQVKNTMTLKDEMLPKIEPARFLFFSNQSAVNIPKQQNKK